MDQLQEKPVFKFAVREDLSDVSDSIFPQRANENATGWDVVAAFPDRKPLIFRPGRYAKIPLGFRTFSPSNWWFELRPRSSTFAKKYIHCLYGTVDEDFEGELLFACQYIPDITALGKDLVIEFGEAIGQIVPVKRQEMIIEKVSNETYNQLCKDRNLQRGAGGFGSTRK